jgi:ketosteroid isomerase-like protein
MNTLDIVTKLDKEICGGDLGRAAELLADDFQFVGVAPTPLGKAEAIGLWSSIRAGLPNFNHNMRDLRAAGSIVYAVVEVTGTHQGALAIPHGPTLPATGRTWKNPSERIAITVRNGKVAQWSVEQVPGGGAAGLIAQLS